jgi:hypothetical protein
LTCHGITLVSPDLPAEIVEVIREVLEMESLFGLLVVTKKRKEICDTFFLRGIYDIPMYVFLTNKSASFGIYYSENFPSA